MFRKLKEQLSCIECASVRAEDLYLNSKHGVPARKSKAYSMERRPRTNSLPSSHGNPYVNVSRGSNHHPYGQNFNNSMSYQTLPSATHVSNRHPNTQRGRRTPSLDTSHARSMDSFQHRNDPHWQDRTSTTAGEQNLSQHHRSPYPTNTASLDRHSHANLMRERPGRRMQRGPPPVRRSNSVSSPVVRHNELQQNWPSLERGTPFPVGFTSSPPPERSSSISNIYSEPSSEIDGHIAQNIQLGQHERRMRSVSFAGPEPRQSNSLPRRRSSSISETPQIENQPLNLCGDGLSSSLVSIVKKQWHSQTQLASDTESSSTGKRQMKSILKNKSLKPSMSLDSSTDVQEERKPRGNSVTFADVEHNTSKSSGRKALSGFRPRVALKFTSKSNKQNTDGIASETDSKANNAAKSEQSDVKCITSDTLCNNHIKLHQSTMNHNDEEMVGPRPADTESNTNDSLRINHKPPIPSSTKSRVTKEHNNDVSENKHIGDASLISTTNEGGSLDKTPTVSQEMHQFSSNLSKNSHESRDVPMSATLDSKTNHRRSIQKHAPFCSSSVDSDNCSSSISSDSSAQNAKLRSITQIKENQRPPSPVVKGKKQSALNNESMDSAPSVPHIKKNRSISKRKKRAMSATMKLERVDSDTTDSGLSMDHNLSPVTTEHIFDSLGRQGNSPFIPGSSLDYIGSIHGQTTEVSPKNPVHNASVKTINHYPNQDMVDEPLPVKIINVPCNENVFRGPGTDINHNHTVSAKDNAAPTSIEKTNLQLKTDSSSRHAAQPPSANKTVKSTRSAAREQSESSRDDVPVYENKVHNSITTRPKRPLVKQGSLDISQISNTSSEDSQRNTRSLPRRNSFDEMMNSGSSRICTNTLPLPKESRIAHKADSYTRKSRLDRSKESAAGKQFDSSFQSVSQESQDNNTLDWTLTPDDLPGSNVDSRSTQSLGDFSELTISCGDKSMKSFMDQNDFSRVLIPRENIRTGRLMMKDDNNTFCMCSGNFRVPTKHRQTPSHATPVTIQIYRGLNDKEDRINLLKNTTVLLSIQHRHIHRVYGLCMEGSPYTRDGREVFVLLERTHYLVTLNKLLTWASENNPQLMNTACAVTFALQLGDALNFLEKKGIIHANLSSNTIRLDTQCNLKLGGIEQFPFSSTSAPIRWMSLETLSRGQILPKSAVWTFGVILWEILSVGCRPYQNLKTGQILHQLSKGYRLPCPKACSAYLYNLLMHCWQPRPDDRPNFDKLSRVLFEHQHTLPPSRTPAELFPDREDFWEILQDHM